MSNTRLDLFAQEIYREMFKKHGASTFDLKLPEIRGFIDVFIEENKIIMSHEEKRIIGMRVKDHIVLKKRWYDAKMEVLDREVHKEALVPLFMFFGWLIFLAILIIIYSMELVWFYRIEILIIIGFALSLITLYYLIFRGLD